MMLVAELARLADDRRHPDLTGPELLPVRLAKACTELLPIDAAGLSLFAGGNHRVPIGASDQSAAVAESLQFTVGQGPCLTAHEQGRVVVADEGVLVDTWPAFGFQLMARTPYRSIMSLPLQDQMRGVASVDLYFRDSVAAVGAGSFDAWAVADSIASVLLQAPEQADLGVGGGPKWLYGPAANARAMVWTAIGIASVARECDTQSSLRLLREHAARTGSTIDDLAADLVGGRLTVDELGR